MSRLQKQHPYHTTYEFIFHLPIHNGKYTCTYTWCIFFLKGEMSFVGIGYFFVFMISLQKIIQYGGIPSCIFLMGDICLYMHDVCHTRGVLITPSLHASYTSSSLFLEEVFPMRFFLFLRFQRDCIALYCIALYVFHCICTWVPNIA